jgi:ParB family chromosome partitioning protein
VRRDLFDLEGGGYIQDVALLDALTHQKLEAVAAEVKAEGWKWAETRTVFGWEEQQAFLRGQMAYIPLTDAAQAEADQLQAELDALSEADYSGDEEEAAAEARMLAIETRLDEIESTTRVWSDEVKACAGAVVYLSYGDTVEIERGKVREEDAAAFRPDDEPDEASEEGEAEPETAGSGLAASLVAELTAQKTAALRIELARSPDIALALVAHTLATSAFYQSGSGVLKAQLTTRSLRPCIKEHESCRAMLALDAERERIGDILPGDQDDSWDWCLNAGRDTLLDVLAVAAAQGIDAVESKSDANHRGKEQGQALALALKLDMATWYRPTAAGYFGRISKAAILTDLEAARQHPCAPAWLKMKKGELAALAERETAERRWLPALLQ